MLTFRRSLALVALSLSAASALAQDAYFPPRGSWQRKSPQEVGLDAAKLRAAIDFARENEAKGLHDLELDIAVGLAREPFGDIVGPTKERGPNGGIVIKNGYLIAEWGEPERVDMTFSVTKSFLSTVVGLAYDRGLIPDLNDPVRNDVDGDHFQSEHNRDITWDQMLRQTSDWQGTLWDKPDWADRPEGRDRTQWPNRELHEPGTHWKYNDVRVNLLALCALNVWRRPLPQVLREEVMDPIGASPVWRWNGYRNSWVTIDGLSMQSVSGGGHWGGGMFISARDMARFGYLMLRRGMWGQRRILSEKWIAMARTPTGPRPTYGFMNWFLNTDKKGQVSSGPESAVTFLGSGTNAIYIDWENDLVVVVRWIDNPQLNPLIGMILDALK